MTLHFKLNIALHHQETHRFRQNKRVLHEVDQVRGSGDGKEEMSRSQASVDRLI